MRAAVLNTLGEGFAIEDVVLDEPRGHEVLVQTRAAGLCHSDLHFAEHDFGNPLPMILGHEVAGVVLAVGPDVSTVAVGDHVVGTLVRSCGHCANCSSGMPYRCTQRQELIRAAGDPARISRSNGAGVTQGTAVGGFAEQALIHENQLAVVPTEVPFAQAAILGCAVITGVGSVLNTAQVQPGESVAVIGLGGVGLNVVSGARIADAGVIVAVDTNPAKLELAKRFGATHVVDASAGDPVAAVRELTGGVRHAFEVVGLESTTLQAVRMTATGGATWLIGLHRPKSGTTINLLEDVLMPQRTIVGTYMGSTDIKRDIPRYARLYLDGKLNLDDLISRQISLSDINAGFDDMRAGAVARSVITDFSG